MDFNFPTLTPSQSPNTLTTAAEVAATGTATNYSSAVTDLSQMTQTTTGPGTEMSSLLPINTSPSLASLDQDDENEGNINSPGLFGIIQARVITQLPSFPSNGV